MVEGSYLRPPSIIMPISEALVQQSHYGGFIMNDQFSIAF